MRVVEAPRRREWVQGAAWARLRMRAAHRSGDTGSSTASRTGAWVPDVDYGPSRSMRNSGHIAQRGGTAGDPEPGNMHRRGPEAVPANHRRSETGLASCDRAHSGGTTCAVPSPDAALVDRSTLTAPVSRPGGGHRSEDAEARYVARWRIAAASTTGGIAAAWHVKVAFILSLC